MPKIDLFLYSKKGIFPCYGDGKTKKPPEIKKNSVSDKKKGGVKTAQKMPKFGHFMYSKKRNRQLFYTFLIYWVQHPQKLCKCKKIRCTYFRKNRCCTYINIYFFFKWFCSFKLQNPLFYIGTKYQSCQSQSLFFFSMWYFGFMWNILAKCALWLPLTDFYTKVNKTLPHFGAFTSVFSVQLKSLGTKKRST